MDAEHALDVAYARRLGVNTDELLISQPDYGEQALDIADMLVRSGAVDMVVIDSVAALIPQPSWKATWAKPRWAAMPGSCPTPCAVSPALSTIVAPR
mgnify:CR=1 FL=1